jgi:hypothetical protein
MASACPRAAGKCDIASDIISQLVALDVVVQASVTRCADPFFAGSLPDVRVGMFSPFANAFNPLTMCNTASDCPKEYAMDCMEIGGPDMSSIWDSLDVDPFGMRSVWAPIYWYASCLDAVGACITTAKPPQATSSAGASTR